MKYLGKIIGISAAILLLGGCAHKSSAAAQIQTPDEQAIVVEGEKQRMPMNVIL